MLIVWVRYLGVVLDSKLSFRPHIVSATIKANKALHSLSSSSTKMWGLGPNLTRWNYSQVVQPSLLFGSLSWHHRMTHNKSLLALLEAVHWTALLMITGSFSSSPSKSLEIMAGIRHIHFSIQCHATNTALHLKVNGSWTRAPPGNAKLFHARELDVIIDSLLSPIHLCGLAPKVLDISAFFSTDFLCKETALTEYKDLHLTNNYVAYTDGSVRNSLAGAGGVIFAPEGISTREFHWKLGTIVTIFQAELFAIDNICKILQDTTPANLNIVICCDSQAAIRALNSLAQQSKSVISAKRAIKYSLGQTSNVKLVWTPSHIGIPGNEWADSLANIGSSKPPVGPGHSYHSQVRIPGG